MGYTFLKTDSRLTEEQIDDLGYRATSMYLFDKETKQNFRDDDLEYEGSISTKGEFNSFGGLWGQKFYAEIDTKYGKITASFLINEQTMGSRTSASNN